MMKKLIALLTLAALALSCTAALAATYTDPDGDITFDYDEALFEITMDDHTDDEDLVILTFKDESWGKEGGVRIYLKDLEDGETFPTLADFAELEQAMNTTVEQMDEWAGFKNVFVYDVETENTFEETFIAPVYDDDDDGEIEDLLTVEIIVELIDDEETGMTRDDAISAIVDSLKVND